MSLKVKARFENSIVHYRRGNKMILIRKMGEATQEQLQVLEKSGHPGVIDSKPAAKAGSS